MRSIFKHILLADDNDANRLITRTILERSGFEVTTATNGAQALSLADVTQYDLILLDIMMPVMDGVRTLKQMRAKSEFNQKTPVFALTAYCSPQDRQGYLRAGFDIVLKKPLQIGDIEDAIKAYSTKGAISSAVIDGNLNLSETAPLIDETILSQLTEVADAGRLAVIQARFWTSVEKQCAIIKDTLPEVLRGSATHLSKFRRAAHAVKGASASMGLARVEQICRRLQNAPLSDIPNLMHIFADALSESRPKLDQALSGSRQLNAPMKMGGHDQTKSPHYDQDHRTPIRNQG